MRLLSLILFPLFFVACVNVNSGPVKVDFNEASELLRQTFPEISQEDVGDIAERASYVQNFDLYAFDVGLPAPQQLLLSKNAPDQYIIGSVISMNENSQSNQPDVTQEVISEFLSEAKANNWLIEYKAVESDSENPMSAVVFIDTQCGYCKRFHQSLDEFLDAGIDISYVMFPIMGQRSEDETRTIFCAPDQDSKKDILHQAKNDELENSQLTTCDGDLEYMQQIMMWGSRLGIQGTPTAIWLPDQVIGPITPRDAQRFAN